MRLKDKVAIIYPAHKRPLNMLQQDPLTSPWAEGITKQRHCALSSIIQYTCQPIMLVSRHLMEATFSIRRYAKDMVKI